MEAKEFIYQELKKFVKHFPKTRIRYEYDDSAMVHVVEVLPNEVYNLDNDYIQWENNFWEQFVLKFPAENICFISDDDVIGIENHEFIFEGLEFAPITSRETKNLFSTNVFQNVNQLFNKFTYTDKMEYKFSEINIPKFDKTNNLLMATDIIKNEMEYKFSEIDIPKFDKTSNLLMAA